MKKLKTFLFYAVIVISGIAQNSAQAQNTHQPCFPNDNRRTVDQMKRLVAPKNDVFISNYRAELAAIITEAMQKSKDPKLRKTIQVHQIGWVLEHTQVYENSFARWQNYLNGSKFGDEVDFTYLEGVTSYWFVFKYEDVTCVWGKRSCGNLQKLRYTPPEETPDFTPEIKPQPKPEPQPQIQPQPQPQVQIQPQPYQQQAPCQQAAPCQQPQIVYQQAPVCQQAQPCQQQPAAPAPIQYPQAPQPRRAFWGIAGGVVLAIGVVALYYGRTIWARLTGAPVPPAPTPTPVVPGGPGGPGGSGTNGGPGGPGGSGNTGGPGGSGGSGTTGHWEFVNGQWEWKP